MKLTKTSLKTTKDNHDLFDDQAKPCLDLINEAVAAEPGIVGVKLDPQQQQIAFDYDPRVIAEPAVTQIAQQIAFPLQHNLEKCVMRLGPRGGRACESCALLLENRLGQIEGVRRASASYRGGVLSLTYDHTLISPDQLKEKMTQLGVRVAPSSAELPAPVEAVTPAQSPLQQRWRWLSPQKLEAVFTVITLVAMSLAWLAEHFGAPPWVVVTLYAIAYVTGGTFGVKASLESLSQRTLDVDLLMVLAALGAAVVGSPFEGALLLFLFSLSNVLQDFAMGRTRNAIRALMKLRPNQALVRQGEEWVTLSVEKVVVGDCFIVNH